VAQSDPAEFIIDQTFLTRFNNRVSRTTIMKTPFLKWGRRAGAVALLGAASGCACGPPWRLDFNAKTDASVRVDIVGINVIDKPDWKAVAVDDYWTNPLRKHADRLTFKLVNGKFNLEEATVTGGDKGLSGEGTGTVTVTSTNAVWKQWANRRAAYLVVIGDFPGSSPGTPDLRKKIVPMPSKYWEAEHCTLQFQIQDNQVEVSTPPSAKAQKLAAKGDP